MSVLFGPVVLLRLDYPATAASSDPPEQGTVGAGVGATVGKVLGRGAAMKGGVGCASMDLGGGVVLAAIVVVNAIGGVHDPDSGELLCGPRGEDGRLHDSIAVYADPHFGKRARAARTQALGNTTIGVIATTAMLTKSQANRLATMTHDGLALAIRPTHTPHDGDTMFALAELDSMLALGAAAARVEKLEQVLRSPHAQGVARHFLVPLEHPEAGTTIVAAAPWHFDGQPVPLVRPSPCMGEHSFEVFREELGMSELGEITMASPAISGVMILFRTRGHLIAVAEKP